MPATWKRLITTGDNSQYKNSSIVASDLPLATTSAVGGVSIGSGLSVNGSGVLTADSQSGTVQTLSISGNTITLSDSGGSVTVPDNDTQDLSISGRTISLTNGGSVSVPASSTEDFTTARKNKVDFISVTQAVNLDTMESDIATNTLKTGITSAQASAITANSAKVSNVTTNLGVSTSTSKVTVTSSDGTNAQIGTATASQAGVMSTTLFNNVATNNGKVSCNETNVKNILAGLDENDTLYIGDGGNDASINIRGNLNVTGTTTTVNTATLNVSDNIITLNSDVTGTPSQNGGIQVERGTGDNANIIWSESDDRWMLDYASKKANITVTVNNSSAPGNNDTTVAGKGNFWLDTSNNQMYVMLAG